MNSLELTRELYKKGYISKEAAVATLRERDKLIKEALFIESVTFFKKAFKVPRWLGGGVVGQAGIGAAKPKGILGRLRVGGKTPGKKWTEQSLPEGTKATPVTGTVGWSDVGGNLIKILALAGLTSAGAAGIGAVVRSGRDKVLQREIETSYKLMKREHRIGEMDQKQVRNHFEVLSRYAPSLAANPTVAGAFVAASVQRGIIDPQMIRTLAEAQEKIDKSRGLHTTHSLPLKDWTALAQAAMSGGG